MGSASRIHPNWDRPPLSLTDGYSLEITAKDRGALRDAASRIPKETPIAITFLPGEDLTARVAATRTVRELGLEPTPHFSARRIASDADFEAYLEAVTAEAGVKRCFVVAGDPAVPEGPFADSFALIATGAFERNGITAIGIGGHPEGHPVMTEAECWQAIDCKCAEIERRGMAPLIVTQFAFDPHPVLSWLQGLRGRGIDVPVRIGVPGPAGIKTLIRFAAHCGVSASAAVMAKYGISLSRLIGTAGPDKLVDAIEAGLGDEHGKVRLHFYPFGGIERTVAWIDAYEASAKSRKQPMESRS